MAKAYLICGSTGAGKSTFAKKLSEEFEAQVYSIDEWMKGLFWSDSPKTEVFSWALERVKRCEDLILTLAQRQLVRSQSVVLDLGFTTRQQRQRVFEKLQGSGHVFELIYLEVPAEVRRQRVQYRNLNRGETFAFEVSEQMFDFVETLFEAPTAEELVNGKIIRN